MLALATAQAVAQQPPAAADLPAAYRGSDIEQALTAHDWQHAEQALVRAIEHSPGSAALLEVLGRVFLIERKPLNAAIAFKKAEAIRPLDDRTRFALVLAYISLHHGDWARPELERLASSDRANVTYQDLAGTAGLRRRPIQGSDRTVRAGGRTGPSLRSGLRQPGALLRSAERRAERGGSVPQGRRTQSEHAAAVAMAAIEFRHIAS